jgi:hypothetical protein
VNERQNNVTSYTNCPYHISTFIPLDIDKIGAVYFFSSTVNISFAKDGYLINERDASYEKGTKIQKRYKATRNVTKLRTWYEVTKRVRNKLRNKLRNTLDMKLPSYEIVTPPIGIIYYDV